MARRFPRGNRGDAGATAELTLATPLLLLLVTLILQVGLWAHGQQTAEAIARQALAVARGVEASEADGQARAEEVADQLGGQLLDGVEVEVERGAEEARVQVEAEVPSLIPGLSWPVHADVSAPVERLDSLAGAVANSEGSVGGTRSAGGAG